MDHYVKTHLGVQALKQRSFQLNARQRQLLLLIGTDDFRILNSAMKQRLATPEIIQQLEQLGLIFSGQQSSNHSTKHNVERTNQIASKQPVNNVQNESIDTTEAITENDTQPNKNHEPIENKVKDNLTIHHEHENEPSIVQQKQNNYVTEKENPYLDLEYLDLEEVKQTMMGLLKLHCGLMAKQLILNIQHAQSVREIKLCQMQWITALQETRIPRDELNFSMQKINRSLQHLYIS